jgi:predicted metalloprotease with PDZ domain
MHNRPSSRSIFALFFCLLVVVIPVLPDRTLEPIVFTISFPAPEKQYAEVEAAIPTGFRPQVELMMAVWSPGFYRVEDYASRVQGLTARLPDGKVLTLEQTRKNRWLIQTDRAPRIVVSYLENASP